MSTTINVTVDDGGLPAKNKQQTAANRQAFVQGQASQQAAQQGVDQRAADRRAAGLDPATGRPLASAGASSRLPRIEQEPAANRRGGLPHVLLIPSADYKDYGGTLTGFVERARNARDVRFSRFMPQDPTTYVWGRNMAPGQFVAGGGPNGSNCLETKDNGQDGFLIQYTGLTYAVVDQHLYDSIYNGLDYREWPLRLWIANEVAVPTSKHTLGDCTAHTVEWFFRFGNNTLGAGTEVVGNFFNAEDYRQIILEVEFGGLAVSMTLQPTATKQTIGSTPPFIWVIGDKLTFSNFTIQSAQYSTAPLTYNKALPENVIAAGLDISVQEFTNSLSIAQDSVGEFGGTGSFFPAGFTENSWHHFAIVRSAQGLYSFYIDGQTIFNGVTVKESWAEFFGASPITGDIRMEVDYGSGGTMEGYLHPAVHGYRFTPRALYSANFTPPASITSFA